MADSRGSPEHSDGHKMLKKPPVMPKPKHQVQIENDHTTTPPSSPSNATQTPLIPPKSPKGNEEGSNGHRRPMPPPRSSSIPNTEEDVNLMSESTANEPLPTAAHVYPSPSYNVESMNLFSPTAASPARMTCISQALSLQELVDKYSQSFPMQIKVLHGYSGQTAQLTLSSGDYYNIHFVKRQAVVSLRDTLGFTYTIPLNSALQFGLVQSEDAHLQKEYDSRVYEKVSDLLALSPLPKIVCATKDAKASDDKNTIRADEILVIKRAFKPKLLGKRSLEVLSLKTHTTKLLSPDCEGCFSLSPQRNKIYLLEFVKCIPNPFPCQALIFVSDDISSTLQCISPSLLSGVVILTGNKCETSLIASSVTYTESEEHSMVSGQVGVQEAVVDIPVDERLSDVEVAVVETVDLRQQERLFDKTRNLFENFDTTRVTSCYDVPNDNVYITQSLLYASAEKGSGVQVDKPLAAYAKSTSPVGTDGTQSMKSEDEVVYESVPSMEGVPTTLLDHSSHDLQPHYAAVGQYEEPSSRMLLDAQKGSSLPTQSFPGQTPYHNGISNPRAHYDIPCSSQRVRMTSPAAGMRLRRSQSQEVISATDLPDYEDMRPLTPSLRRFLSSSILPGVRETETKLDKVVATSDALESSIRELSKRMTHMEHQVSEVIRMSAMMKTLSEGMAALNSQINQLRGEQGRRGRDVMNAHSSDDSKSKKHKDDESRQYLEQLDMTQVWVVH